MSKDAALKHDVGESIDYGEIYVNDSEHKVQIVLGDADPTELFDRVERAAKKEYPNYKIDVGSEDKEWNTNGLHWRKVKVSGPQDSISRVGAATRNQLLRMAEGLPEDRSSFEHQWPDGWTMRRLKTYGDMHREGMLMGNCFSPQSNPNEATHKAWFDHPQSPSDITNLKPEALDLRYPLQRSLYSLRDPDNLPHASIDLDENDPAARMLGRHNGPLKPQYEARLADWLDPDTEWAGRPLPLPPAPSGAYTRWLADGPDGPGDYEVPEDWSGDMTRVRQLSAHRIDSALETECQTPGAIYDTEIGPKDVKVDVKLPGELDLDEDQAELLEKNLHNVVELALAPHFATESPFAVTVRTMKRDGYSEAEISDWADYLAYHNEADRDSGELDDVPDEQVERWCENWESEGRPKTSNILDPVQPYLDPSVWLAPNTADPQIKPKLNDWIHKTIYGALERNGYEGPNRWLKMVLTGSLTTYQYSSHSDCDISLFVVGLPEWSRGEMIGVMVKEFDGILLPGTAHDIQAFVVSKTLTPRDLYRPGLRSAYDLEARKWLVPPDHAMAHDVEHEMNSQYAYALDVVDKMDRLLRYEPEKAVQYYGVLHRRRMRDQTAGKGDFSPSNLAYKMILNRGYGEKLKQLGVQIS